MAFWTSGRLSSSMNSSTSVPTNAQEDPVHIGCGKATLFTRKLFPTRRRLRLDPSSKLYFPYEPGKQVRSAVRIKNTSKSHVVFKFQTTAPKSCFMRPPGGTLSPGESIVATVFKFVENPASNEKLLKLKSNAKFKIMSLKVKEPIDYVPELFDEQKDQVLVEQILRVVFFYMDRPSPIKNNEFLPILANNPTIWSMFVFCFCVQTSRCLGSHAHTIHLDKLKDQLAEADAALEARKKPPEETGPRTVGEGLVIDEWKERRERYLARQQIKAVDPVLT